MEQSASWEANRFAASQEIHRIPDDYSTNTKRKNILNGFNHLPW
jgi:hypothetical protein